MKFSQIKETCLYVTDLDRTEEFYREKLNLEVIGRVDGRHIFFKAGSSVLLCFIAETTRQDQKLPAHFGEGKMHLAFEVPAGNYSEMKKLIRSKGIEIELEYHWYDAYSSFYFRDPDGHSLEVIPEGLWD